MGHTASMTIGGGGPCVQVEQFPRREGAIGVVPARARVTRLGCCDDPDGAVTITASGDTFRSQTFATNFSFERAPAATASQPANCVDTTLTIDDSQNHANIVRADGQDSTTVTVGAGCRLSDCPLTISRWLKTDFGSFGGEVNCTTDQASTNQTQQVTIRVPDETATATHRAGCINSGSTNTTEATIQAFGERPTQNSTPLKSVKALHYNGFDFTNLGIPDNEMIVSIPSSTTATALNTTVSQDASVIQDFFETNQICQNRRPHGSFLRNFYINTHTKEGFYDQDEDGSFDSDTDNSDLTGDILYEPPMGQNQAGDSTRANDDFDDCTGTVAQGNRQCGDTISAAVLMARLASCENAEDANSGNAIFDCSMKRSHRVTPRNMLVTLQKEQSLTVSRDYPTEMMTPNHDKLHEAMGCGVTDNRAQNLANRHLYNFYNQIDCSVNTFVERYTEENYNEDSDRPLAFPSFFFKLSDGVKHGEIHPYPVGDRVSFSVANRITYVQYRYTPWIQADNNSGGVHLFYSVWNGRRFRHVDWSTGRPTQ